MDATEVQRVTDLSVASLLELESLHLSRPMPKSNVRWFTNLDDPSLGDVVMMIPYAIANEHVGLHAVLLDRPLPDYSSPAAVTVGITARPVRQHLASDLQGIRQSWDDGYAVFVATWDGRDPDGRRATMHALAPIVGPVFATRRPPRLVVPSPADWTLLRDAFAWELPLRARFHDRDVEQFALHTHWWIERAKIPGQQSVIVLWELLHQAWQVPLEPDDRLHLGASLACFDPAVATSADVIAAVHQAELAPAGPRSLPSFDNDGFLDALGAIGRPPDPAAWEDAMQMLWGHVEHRRAHLHRATRIAFADPGFVAAPSVYATGVASRPGLIDLELGAWTDHSRRRSEVLTAYAAYDAAFITNGATAEVTNAARRDANTARNLRLPRHLPPWRFRQVTRLTDGLDLRAILEDRFARADARRRGIAVPGRVTVADRPIADPPRQRNGRWAQVFTFSFTVDAGGRPLGRFRLGRGVAVGDVGVNTAEDVRVHGIVTNVNHAASTITIAYTRNATSSLGPTFIREPRPRLAPGEDVELLPALKYAGLGDGYEPIGPAPRTHAGSAARPAVVSAARTAPRPIPADLQ
jgi:hypothetical protein